MASKKGGAPRMTRPEPARTGPKRNAGMVPPPGPIDPPGVGVGPDDPRDSEIHKIVADAVKLGYDVLGQNLSQGRSAADRLRVGAYGAGEVQDDVSQLSGRLAQMARDLATVWFDLIGAVVRDPALHEALRPKPTPPPSGGDRPSSEPVKVGCVVKGNDRAKAAPLYLSQPDNPSRLTVAGLHSPETKLPPITNIAFMASDDAEHVMVVITVPADQAPGVYSGVVCDAGSHAPLGTLSVQVSK
ncbi:MAG TPA: hypothetical protein VIO94_14610 [Phenylobacterium sp.]